MNKYCIRGVTVAAIALIGIFYFSFRSPGRHREKDEPAIKVQSREAGGAALFPEASQEAGRNCPFRGNNERDKIEIRLGEKYALSSLPQVLQPLDQVNQDWREFKPREITVELLPGMRMRFGVTSVKSDGNRTIWIGTNEVQGAALVASGTKDLWDATITIPGAYEYGVQVTPEYFRVTEAVLPGPVCNLGRRGAASEVLSTYRPVAEVAEQAQAESAESGQVQSVDLLILYTAGVKADLGGAPQVINRANSLVAMMNHFLDQSKVSNFRWRLVGVSETPAYQRPYIDPAKTNLSFAEFADGMALELAPLLDTSTTLGRFAADKRNEVGADQVALVIDSSVLSGGRAAGLEPSDSYCVVAYPGMDAGTLAHELGHLFGCHHDRETCGVQSDDTNYWYGHRFVHNGKDTGTLMSYSKGMSLPYFSNPEVKYDGVPLGVAAGQPGAADNARWLREHAGEVAGQRDEKMLAPTIQAQPQSVTVQAGGTFSLGIVAQGTGLAYQWYRNGVEVEGANSNLYAKSSCTGLDQGSYTVTVSNSLGSVTSSTAVVTVTPLLPVISPTVNISGNSGGGGSLSGWALGMLCGASALRFLRNKRRRA